MHLFYRHTAEKDSIFLPVPKPFSVTAALMLLLSSFPRHHCSETRRFQPYAASITPACLYQVQNIIEGPIAAAALDWISAAFTDTLSVHPVVGCLGSLTFCHYL